MSTCTISCPCCPPPTLAYASQHWWQYWETSGSMPGKEISLNACLSQMFCIHLFTFMESSVLLAMAFDRFVAISNPLRYATILTHTRIAQIGLAVITRGTVILTPLVLLFKRLSFCHSHVLHHSYCFHPDVLKTFFLSSGDAMLRIEQMIKT